MRADPLGQKHILFILEYFYPHVGGVETLFDHLTEALVVQGYKVTVVTLWLPGCAMRETRKGVEIVRIRTPQQARRYLFMLLAMRTILRLAPSADVIHTTTYCAAIPAWLGARWARKPAILTVHEVFGDQWNNLPGLHPLIGYAYRFFEWLVISLPFAHYLSDSSFTARRIQRFGKVSPAKISVAYPAVDYDFWNRTRHVARAIKADLSLDEHCFVYLYFGRPGVSKGVEYLVEAAKEVRRKLPGSHLVMLLASDPLGPYRRIQRMIDRNHLRAHITVLDPVPRSDLPGYLLGADCVVVPSVSEGFGYAAVEAATVGCPVIATSAHSVEEVLANCATFVPPRDSTALAQAIIATAQQRPCLAAPTRYDLEGHVASVAAAYEHALRTIPDTTAEGVELVQESAE